MQSIGIVVNKKAKNASTLNTYLEAFRAQGLDFQLAEIEPSQLESTIQQFQSQYPIILIGGGDGSVRSAAQQCVHTKTILGVLPLGTLNHFVKELSLPTTATQLIAAIKQQQTIIIDTAQVNDHIFINNSSIGFYPSFAKKRDYYTRFYNKWLSYLPGLIETLKKHPSFRLKLHSNTFDLSLRTSFLMISNNLYSYEFPLRFSRTQFDQGQLGIYYFKHGKIQLFKILRYFLNRKKSFSVKQSKKAVKIQVDAEKKITVSLDGDTMVLTTPLRYQSLPQSLILLRGPT